MRSAFDRKNYHDYYEEISQKYPEGKIVMGSKYGRLRIKKLVYYANSFAKENYLLLDAGCSSCHFIFSYVRNEMGKRAVGIDIGSGNFKEALNEAKTLGIENSTEFLVGDLEDLPFKNNSFDIILCSEVLEHVLNPMEVICEFAKSLKSGGILIISTPNALQFFSQINPMFWSKCLWSVVKNRVLVDRIDTITTTKDVEKYGIMPTTYKHTSFSPFELNQLLPNTFEILDSKSIYTSFPLQGVLHINEGMIEKISKLFEICPIINKCGNYSLLIARKH